MRLRRRRTAIIALAAAAGVLTGCGGAAVESAGSRSAAVSDGTITSPSGVPAAGRGCLVGLDPGHNPFRTGAHPDGPVYDPITGAQMMTSENHPEQENVNRVAEGLVRDLPAHGIRAVLLHGRTEAKDWRQIIDTAEQDHVLFGLSIHTNKGEGTSAVFPQRVGLSRHGPDAAGTEKTVTFTAAQVAAKSQRFSRIIADARTAGGDPTTITVNSFDGRAGLWAGDLPIVSLLSTRVPWVYSEFGSDLAGGTVAPSPADAAAYDAEIGGYEKNLTTGIVAAAGPRGAA
jgi:N-acetylmuramoyl-L-alanine amidase